MTTYGAYDAGLPCKNPNCKSHGKPHPNCRCYGNMAQGGDVEPYCAQDRVHRRDCKYFAAGGDVHELDIPHHPDTGSAVSAYLSNGGLHSLLKEEPLSPSEAIDEYNTRIDRGHKFSDAHVGALFGGKSPPDKDHTKAKKDIHEWLEKGGIDNDVMQEIHKEHAAPQQFANGGDVKAKGIAHRNHLSTVYPDHNAMLQSAKGLVSNYLTSLKPQEHAPRLAFDDEPDNRAQKKKYEEALHIAAHPMNILEHIKKGTIEPDQIGHLQSMYPEVHDEMQKKITHKITEAQLKGEKPPHHVRQGLSLLMGTPLSGELSPQGIMAAQATFQTKKEAAQNAGPPPKKTSALNKTSQSYLLPNQAAAERQQKQ